MKKLTSIILPLCTVFLFSACAEDSDNNNKRIEPVVSEGLSDNAILHDSAKIGKVSFKPANHLTNGSSYSWSIDGGALENNNQQEVTAEFASAGTYIVTLNVDGTEYKGNIVIPETQDYEIDMGASHTIISDKSQKRLFVYGNNDKGQLCIEKSILSLNEPRILKSYIDVISSVAAGTSHTLFTDNSNIYSCGDNHYGQLGIGNTDEIENVANVSIPSNVTYRRIFVSAGGDMSVAGAEFLDGSDPKITIYSWGYDDSLENKIRFSVNDVVTAAKSREDVLLSTGNNFSVIRATASYNVYSFGINDKWQLGRIQGAGTGYASKGEENKNSPDENPTLNKTDMASGFVYTPYGEEGDYINYYQNNYFAKFATGDDFVVSIKKETKEDSTWTQVPKYSLYVWGNNDKGQLGITSLNSSVGRATPLFDGLQDKPMETDPNKVVPIQKEIIEVAAGSASGYAISSDGILYGWGDDSKHQLTSNKTTNSTNNLVYEIENPQGATGYKKVWAGGDRVIALANDNNLYTWGDNNNGILGINSTEDTVATPEKLYFSLAPIQ